MHYGASRKEAVPPPPPQHKNIIRTQMSHVLDVDVHGNINSVYLKEEVYRRYKINCLRPGSYVEFLPC